MDAEYDREGCLDTGRQQASGDLLTFAPLRLVDPSCSVQDPASRSYPVRQPCIPFAEADIPPARPSLSIPNGGIERSSC
jgi:hypothetical protein